MTRRINGWRAALAIGLLGACGGSSVVEPGGGGGTGGAATGTTPAGTTPTGTTPSGTTPSGSPSPACGLGSVGAQPPPPAPDADQPVSGKVAFAVSELLIGNIDWAGVPSPSAWKQFGYNLDDRISTRDSVDLCRPSTGAAPTQAYPDGNDGIDNSFGKNLLPMFMGLSPDVAEELNGSISTGQLTILFDVAGLGAGPSYDDLYGSTWRGAPLSAAPSFDGSDVWPPYEGTDSSLLCGYANSHTVVLTAGNPVQIPFAFSGIPWVLQVHRPIVTMELAADHQTIPRGVIAGLIPIEEMIEDFRDIAGAFDTGLCQGTTFESIADQFRQASDIMQNGTQNPGATCDAVTVGFGFRGSLVSLGEAEAPPPPPPDPCP
ncbi:MAG: hypothetical protein JRI23_29735 [Deltaproteobacteria bacterium]|jgi:hypothetical protein|nr:hypothetical protein [Deltaproteobacteria bacterium]MBW2536332.1 hypothetical protein [Deltaproteobacteria bacterium]